MRSNIQSQTKIKIALVLALVIHIAIIASLQRIKLRVQDIDGDRLLFELVEPEQQIAEQMPLPETEASPTLSKKIHFPEPTKLIEKISEPEPQYEPELKPEIIPQEQVAESMPHFNRLVFIMSDPFNMYQLPMAMQQAIQDSLDKRNVDMQDSLEADIQFELARKLEEPRLAPANGLISIPRIIYEIAKAMRERARKKPVTFDFIPDEKQLEVLKILWEQELASDRDIYTMIGTDTKIMMEDLNTILVDLTKKGILARRMVSPRNEFTLVGIPLFEMNPINRKNRMYQYTSRVSSEEVITFLNSQAYKAAKDSSDSTLQIIEEKILEISHYNN